ncbi:aromatic ring-hydroxylating oxygenase subunit alpha [Montanilutibacter psychrotolerans]|uniref:Aromatic ring-hydroxylating dioxygenase subunit alpha n=1 Tax=Montanilutibacter psychrotolerans TaxID=1327343 RepID=A0A3M8SUZ8_9GAMM|nr:aromatic ring-hydroxylating dioxygenase subunit alpha [Lysobacter psychrotolerans]RNF82542.1 aromatic ring-hydroxylating dioxygenase subunit alpha [Lysobacter psychrotolerans]
MDPSDDLYLIAQPLAHATALPAHFYTDPAMVARDRRAVFDRGWQLLAHVCQLQAAGDHVVGDFAGLPVIAVRGADDVIRVFHNVCRHRAGPIASCDGLAAKSLRCRYHGWTYGLDGVLRSAPEMGSAEDFNVADVRLPQLAVRIWQGLVFAVVDEAHAPSFDAFVAGIDARLGADRGLEHYGHHHRVGYDVACNWKVYVDNYLEGYHVPHIHPGLNKLLDYRSYITQTAHWYSFQFSPLESGDGLYGDGDALYYWLWPNTMLNILPGRLQTNRVVPLGADRCRVEFDFYYTADDSGQARARREADLAFSDEVQLEDLTICEDVQRGLASGSYQPGRLNPLRENAVHHFHELLRGIYRNASAEP